MGTQPPPEQIPRAQPPGVFTSVFDWEIGTPVSELVHEGIATATRSSLEDVAPLDESIDDTALKQRLETHANGGEKPRDCLRFTHEGCLVTLHAEGRLTIRLLDGE